MLFCRLDVIVVSEFFMNLGFASRGVFAIQYFRDCSKRVVCYLTFFGSWRTKVFDMLQ